MLLNLIAIEDRFWSKVDKSSGIYGSDGQYPTECWQWIAGKNEHGYGLIALKTDKVIHRRKRQIRAHRLVWELCIGAIPDNLQVLHKCDNRSCVNPDHLFLGTQLDNMRDMRAKGRQQKVYNRGGENANRRKLTKEQVQHIRDIYAAERSEQLVVNGRFVPGRKLQEELAVRFGVTQSTISSIILYKSWK